MRDTTKMKFYTGAWLYKSKILVVGYDNGQRFVDTIRYKPYMFVESKTGNTGWKTIKGKPVERMDFPNIHEKREFYKNYNKVSGFNLYGLTNDLYTYLNDAWEGEQVDYDVSLIKALNIDIEVAADEGFPSIEDATKPVTAVTMKMINDDKIYVLGCGEYENNNENVVYVKCETEAHLLRKFIDIWKALDPDVVTGWNVEMFDVPYMVNRITNILGFDDAQEMSPFGIINDRRFVVSRTDGTEAVRPDIIGVTILDYLVMYRKFTYVQQESYRLDNIAAVELGEKKLDYSEYDGLLGLYKNNYQKFIDYNIKDVELVDKLENKLGLLELVYAIAYDGKVNYVDAYTSVRMWDIIIHNHLWRKKIVIPQLDVRDKERRVDGAYVKDPQTGMHKWIVSFDLNSLYPHLIMQYNIGPDTFHETKLPVSVQEIIDGQLDNHRHYLEEHNLSCTGSGAMYSKDKRSFLATLMDKMYSDRVVFKNKMNEYKQKQEDTGEDYSAEIAKAHNMQMAKKIQLNSAYGALGNNYFRWFDVRYAESITLSGQLSIRWMQKHINEYLNKTLKTDNIDYVIACDTDSMYLTLDKMVEKVFEGKDPKQSEIIDWMDKVAEQVFEPFIDKCYQQLADLTNAYEQKMFMKREALADKGIWTAKKRYALHVHDMEGVRFKKPYMKIQGMETQRSSVPQICRDKMKAAMQLIMTQDEKALVEFVEDFRKEFKSKPFEDIAFPRGVRGIDKYKNSVTLYNKGTPIHVRGALVYNYLLEHHGLGNIYNPIYDGDKIKFCYLKVPNPGRENVIAVSTGLPEKFNMERYIDFDTQFEKSFLEPMRTVCGAIQWKMEKGQATLEDFF